MVTLNVTIVKLNEESVLLMHSFIQELSETPKRGLPFGSPRMIACGVLCFRGGAAGYVAGGDGAADRQAAYLHGVVDAAEEGARRVARRMMGSASSFSTWFSALTTRPPSVADKPQLKSRCTA